MSITAPQVTFSNYEEYEAWYNHHIVTAWKETGYPTHLTRGDLNIPTGGKLEKEQVISFIKELGFTILCTEDISRNTFEQFYCIATRTEYEETIGNHTHIQGSVLSVSLDSGLWFRVYTHKSAIADEISKRLKEGLKCEDEEAEKKSKFAFWQMDDDGCRVQYSRLDCPDLDDLKPNYHQKPFEEVKRVLDLDEPYKHGKIILWHGPPGNGKTYLIRAACKYWIEKFDIVPEVIIDPQQLFGYSRYLTTLLLRRTAKKDQPFRLFIAEDCAQLFSSDGRNQEGFDRLLNIADGLLGQGQKIVFLFTANEKIEDIDPAILRPGRCLQNVLIDNWSKNQAAEWLKNHEIYDEHADNLGSSNSLAELYAMLNGVIPAKQHKANNFGFKA